MKSYWNFAEFKVVICLNVLQNCSAKQKLLPEMVEISKKIVLVRGNSPRPIEKESVFLAVRQGTDL